MITLLKMTLGFVQDLLRSRLLCLNGTRNPHLLHVYTGFCAPSYNGQQLVTSLNRVIEGFIKLTSLVLLTTLFSVQSIQAEPLTIISLTFDDGRDESDARSILASHGMHGTFYINSDRIGSGGGYLTKAEVDGLYADGNEIGGHTIGHANLGVLSDAAQKKAICDDMENLVNWGYEVHSLAYPFSSTGPSTQSIVAAGCPGVGTYDSARAVGGLRTSTTCTTCPTAESMPPSNRYYIATHPSVVSTTTLADMKSYVTQAEANGGGWVPMVFHRICDGCSNLAITLGRLDDFLTWLEAREAGGTIVRTVHQVMSGDFPEPPQPQLGPNLLINPSLEKDDDGNNQADCWQRGSFGVNSASWLRTNDSHTGNFAEQLQVTSYTNGDRKLLTTLDSGQSNGGCAPSVVSGSKYQLSAWYKSTIPVVPVLFYLDNANTWQYWRDGAQQPTSSSWTQMTYNPGNLPAGAQAISFGMSLQGLGTLTTDDYSIAQVLDDQPPVDNIPPVISGISPENGTTVSGDVSLAVAATDNIAVQRVEFFINGVEIDTDTSSPYEVLWNSASIPDGAATLVAKAFDAAGNSAVTPTVNITVNNQGQSVNLLINPSLENDADNNNMADCWQRGGWGDNAYIWARLSGTATAHSGNFSESLQITSQTSGNRKLVTTQGSSTCSPSVSSGNRYTVGSWYKSTIPARFTVYYRNSEGVWKYWKTSPWSPATSAWSEALYTTPPVPAGATALSFGLYLDKIGTLITDDYSMTLVTP